MVIAVINPTGFNPLVGPSSGECEETACYSRIYSAQSGIVAKWLGGISGLWWLRWLSGIVAEWFKCHSVAFVAIWVGLKPVQGVTADLITL